MKCYFSYLLLIVLLVGCNTEPIRTATTKNSKPFSQVQCGKNIVIAPIVVIYQPERKQNNSIRKTTTDSIPTQHKQEALKSKILTTLYQRLQRNNFNILNPDEETQMLLEDIANNHTTLISQYRSKSSFISLLQKVSKQVHADGVILIEVSIHEGSSGYYNIYSGAMGENTSYTSYKMAYILTQNAEHKWYGEIYMRDTLEEVDIEKIFNTLLNDK